MNHELFLARRIAFRKSESGITSRPIIRIAMAAVALGFAVMIIAVAVVSGFKKEISEKVIGFSAHIQISNFDENNSYETRPVKAQQPFLSTLRKDPAIAHVQVFATKAGIIKTSDQLEGVVAKGTSDDFDWSFFQNKMVEGKTFNISKDVRNDSILISKNLANKLHLKAGDDLAMFFIQQPPRARKFHIAGVYQTGLEEFDNLYVFCDIRHLQKLNDWDSTEVGGFEIKLKDFSNLEAETEKIYALTGSDLNVRSVKEIYPQLFDWLGLQNVNAIIIITLMVIVSAMNMISALLIIILERVNMIGMLKALGSTSGSIRKVFVYLAAILIGRGLLWGNAIGLALIGIQQYWGVFKLDQTSYYLSKVPVYFTFMDFAILNLGTLLVCSLMMIIPTRIVSSISPISALRYN